MRAYSIFYVHHKEKWFLTERIILCKINTISRWGIKTFYLDTKNTNFGLSTIHLVGVDMIEIANSILIIENIFLYDIKTHK